MVLFWEGEEGDLYWIGDGYHRIGAARRVGFTTITAEVRPGGQREALLYAAGANQTHGLRRTNADKRRAVLILLQDEEWRQWSDREIARHCGVSHEFVPRLRPSLSTVDSEEAQRTYTTRHGTVATMDTSNIGARQVTPAPVNGEPGSARSPRELVRELYGEGVAIPPPPAERPYAMEESLGDIHSRVLLYLEAVERKGGIKVMTQDWTQDRKRDFLQKVREIAARWEVFAADVETAAPQALFTIVSPVAPRPRP